MNEDAAAMASRERIFLAGAPHAPGQVVDVMPCKGGSGATFIATNVAYLLAQTYQQDTVLVDLDLQLADASYYLSNDEHRNNLLDLTRHLERLDPHLFQSSLHPIIPHLFLLAAPNVAELHIDITPAQIERCCAIARQTGAAASARPIAETLKRCNPAGVIEASVDRTHVWAMETPQIFATALLRQAYARVLADGITFTVPTTWNGETCLRLCIVNPETTVKDIELVLETLK